MNTAWPLLLALCAPLLLAPRTATGQADDPLKSAECGRALQALQAARQARAQAAEVEEWRRRAARSCLGGAARPGRPARLARPPTEVPPPRIELPARAPATVPAPPPPPPVAIGRPPLPAQCDVSGCWTSDGSHLRHVPPGVAGPNGLCVPVGGMVYCP